MADRPSAPLDVHGVSYAECRMPLLEQPQKELLAGADVRPPSGSVVERARNLVGLGDREPGTGRGHPTSVALRHAVRHREM